MTTPERRLADLEQRAGTGADCPECSPAEPRYIVDVPRVQRIDEPEGPDPEPVRCGTCGRLVPVHVVKVPAPRPEADE